MTMMPVPVVPVMVTPSPMPVAPTPVSVMPAPMAAVVPTPVMAVTVMAPAHLFGLDAIDFVLCHDSAFHAGRRGPDELLRGNRRQRGCLRTSRERRCAGDQSKGEAQKISAFHDVPPPSRMVMPEEVSHPKNERSLNLPFRYIPRRARERGNPQAATDEVIRHRLRQTRSVCER